MISVHAQPPAQEAIVVAICPLKISCPEEIHLRVTVQILLLGWQFEATVTSLIYKCEFSVNHLMTPLKELFSGGLIEQGVTFFFASFFQRIFRIIVGYNFFTRFKHRMRMRSQA
jgi:hypothetical protein